MINSIIRNQNKRDNDMKIIINIPILKDWLDRRRNVFDDVGRAIGMLKIGRRLTPQQQIFIQETSCKALRLRFKCKKQKIQYKKLKDLMLEENITYQEEYKEFFK